MKNRKIEESITILLPAGRLPLYLMKEVHDLAQKFKLGIYLSNMQNLRLTNVQVGDAGSIRLILQNLGVDCKGPGRFPIPQVCIGKNYCDFGMVDTEALSQQILDRFGDKKHTKGKLKIAVSGCTMCCSGVKTSDIGVMATRDGYEVYLGGKGGPNPRVGRRVERKADGPRVLEIIEQVVEFHDKKTERKQRIYKLLDHEDFPFREV